MQNLLLLHGALGSESQFEELSKRLGNTFMVHSFDFKSHGCRANEESGFLMRELADEINNYIVSKEIAPCYVFGYSMGGYAALMAATAAPVLFSGIITLGTKFDWNPESAAKEARMLNPEILEEKVPKFAQALANLHGTENWKSLLIKTARMMQDLADGGGIATPDLEQLSIPVRVLLGSLDRMVTERESKQLVNSLAEGSFKLLPDVEHPIDRVDIDVIADEIISFAQLM